MILSLLAVLALQATAADPPLPSTIGEAMAEVQADKACIKEEFPQLAMTLFVCEASLSAWYFTVPHSTFPPGFVRRMVVRDGNAIKMITQSKFFGTDEQESAFLEWQAAIAKSLEQSTSSQ